VKRIDEKEKEEGKKLHGVDLNKCKSNVKSRN
jgi:hypothetical protein